MFKKLSLSTFLISQLIILIFGLSVIGVLYYILNSQPKSAITKPYQQTGGPVTKPPATLTLSLTSPDDDLLVFSPTVVISGKTAPDASILISSDSNNLVVKSKPDGSFSTIFDLSLGVNEITVVAFDQTGEEKTQTRMVYYSKEKI